MKYLVDNPNIPIDRRTKVFKWVDKYHPGFLKEVIQQRKANSTLEDTTKLRRS